MAIQSSLQRISPFLWFDGNAAEAAAFYVSVFPDSRIVQTTHFGGQGPGAKGSVMTVSFDLCGQRFTALNGGPSFKFNWAVSFVVSCETQDEIDRYWDLLTADGGKPVQCGWLEDRFGLPWQIVPTRLWEWFDDPARFERVHRAVMEMVKLDLAALRAAADAED